MSASTEERSGDGRLNLSSAWQLRLWFRAEGDKLWAEGDKLRAEGAKLGAEGAKLRPEGNKLWAEGTKLRAENAKLCAEGDKLGAEGAKLWAEGDKLCAEGDKFCANGDKLWAEAIIEARGNISLEWTATGCRLETGEEFDDNLPLTGGSKTKEAVDDFRGIP